MEWREGSGFLLLSRCSVLHGCISEESGELVTNIIITGNLNKIFSENEIIKKQTCSLSPVCDGCFMERRFLFTDNKVCSRENICFNLTEQKFRSNKILKNEIKSARSYEY